MRRTMALALVACLMMTLALWPLSMTVQASKPNTEFPPTAPTVVQEPPPAVPQASLAKTEAEMKPYKLTIPGTSASFEMVPIKGGTFLLGSPPSEDKRSDDEGPQVKTEIKPFWMGKFEVTWDEFDLFAFPFGEIRKQEIDKLKKLESEGKTKAAVSRPTPPYTDPTFSLGRKGQPVICITHHSAMEYCRWLSEKTGQVYRLPTEAEWEYACRAGSAGPYSFEDADKIGEYAWYVENCEKPQKVGMKKPNPWGLFDIHGNVAEWCLDHYIKDQYSKYPAGQIIDRPVALPSEQEYAYVARGGSWDDDPDRLRSAARRTSEKEWSMQDPQRPQSIWWHTDAQFVGFRVVRALDEQPELRGLKSKVVKKRGAK